MKKSLLTFLVLLVATSSFGQSWLNTGNALQRQTNGTYSNYRFNLGSPGFMYFYNKTQTDSLFNIAVGSGVTSFNTRAGAVIPLVGDYSSFYQPLENQRLSSSYGVAFNNVILSSDATIGDITGFYSRITPSVMVLASTTGGTNATYNNAQIHFHNNTYDWYASLNSGVTHATIDGNTWFTNHAAYSGGRTLNPLDFIYKQKADSLYEALSNKSQTISNSTTLYPSVKAVQDYVTGSYTPTTETVLKVADTTALKAYSGNSNTLQVLEQNTSGVFSYVASATVDGGTVFPATGKGSGYWQRINVTKTNNLLWFGVKGDGSDETGKIQKAINASIYKTLYAPKGVYSVKYLTGVNGITIDGGNVATFKLYAPGRALNTFMLAFTSCHDWTVKNILIDGNLANLPGTDTNGYFIFNVTGAGVSTKSYNGVFEGVTIKNVGGSAISMAICEDITVRTCVIDSVALGVILYNNTDKIKIVNNSIGHCTTGEGIDLWGNVPPNFSYNTNSIISGNYIHDNPSAGILLRIAKGFTITGNIIENCFSGIYGFPQNGTPPIDGTITGNQIRGGSIGVSGINGVFSNTVISANTIIDCNNTGIQIGSSSFACTTVKVIGNEIIRGVTEGITFNNVTNSSIENNTINDNATTPALIKAIGVNTSCVNISVFNNIIPLATTYKLLIEATGTNIMDYNGQINITSAAVNTNIIKGRGITNNSSTTLLNTEGTGGPALSATVGSVYRRTDGGVGTTLYIKQSGTDGSGWVGVNDYNNLANTSNVMTLNTSQTVTGIKKFGNGTLLVDGAAGTGRDLGFTTAGVSRWFIRNNNEAESGSNAGSNLEIIPRSDAGASLTTAVKIYRSSSIAEFNKAAQYASDVSGTYTTRSLIDKGYADGRYLQLSGGTLTGALNGTTLALSGNVTAAAATTANQVVIKSQNDLKLDLAGGSMTGDISYISGAVSGFLNPLAGNGVLWRKNSDYGKIYFESTSDVAGDSNLILETGDNTTGSGGPTEGVKFRNYDYLSNTSSDYFKVNLTAVTSTVPYVGTTASFSSLTASQAVFTDASKNLVSRLVGQSDITNGYVDLTTDQTITSGQKIFVTSPSVPTPTFSTTATSAVNQAYLPLSVPAILTTLTGVDAKVSANYGVYTVPSGKTAVITAAIIRCTSATSITAGPSVSVVYVGNTIYPGTALTALQNIYDVFGFSTVGMSRAVTAGNTVSLSIDTPATGTAQTVEITLIGYLR